MDINLPLEFTYAGIWLWDNFGKEISSGVLGKLSNQTKNQWDKIEWLIAANEYRSKVYLLHSTIRMLGNPNPVLLEGIYTDVYILDKPSAYMRYNIDTLQQQLKLNSSFNIENQKRVNALDLSKTKDRLFILGKPGAGKTTLLKHLTLLAIKGEIDRIPIFVSLNDWSQSGLSLKVYIEKLFEMCSFPNAWKFIENVLLKKGRAMVLFDGLDEVNEKDDKRRNIIREIDDFTKEYSVGKLIETEVRIPNSLKKRKKLIKKPDNKFFITCRVAASDYSFDDFHYVEIADFNYAQIEKFSTKWFSLQPDKGERFLKELSLPEHRGLREMAQTPILLTLLCLSFDETIEFPPRRVEIYQEAIDALLKKWDASRNIKRDTIYKGLSLVRKQQLFSALAAQYFQEGKYFFEENSLTRKISDFLNKLPLSESGETPDGSLVLKSIEAQHGLLIERAQRIHSFSHLTFQEYFTARYVIEHMGDGTIERLVRNISDSRYKEVLQLTAAMLPEADFFFSLFQSNLNKIASRDENIKECIRWATIKSKEYGQNMHPALKRLLALAIPLMIEVKNYEANTYTLNGYAQSLARILDKSFSKKIVEYLNFQNEDHYLLDIFLARILNRSIAMQNSVKVGYQSLDGDLFLDLKFTIDRAIKLSEKIGEHNLSKKLKKFIIKDRVIQSVKWKNYIKDFREVIIKHRNIGQNWNFENKQINTIQQYLNSSVILVECLNVAAVTNREEIEESLFKI